MKSTDPRQSWARLTAAARLARDERDEAAPYGFSTRVAALARSADRKPAFLMERFALRALGVACLLAIASAAVNFPALNNTASTEEQIAAEDPLSVLLDV